MELNDFLLQTQGDVQAAISERLGASGESYPYPELVFAEIVMQHMADVDMTFEPEVCHYLAQVGTAVLRISGFALSDDADQLDLFVTLYQGAEQLMPVADAETKRAAEQCLRFLSRCVSGRLANTMDESNDAYTLALTIQESYKNLDQIRIYVLTDLQARSRQFQSREISGKTVKLEVMDIERLYRHWSEGKPRDELIVNFEEVSGTPLPCVYVSGKGSEYDYALTVIPGEALRFLYEKYGARLLEANVRSFLSGRGKVNKGISDTLRNAPEHFMAYNNGIVIVADELRLRKTADGSPGIATLKGMQIVNGGQTTASIYFSKKKNPEINLSRVHIPAKVIVLHARDQATEESLISDVSRYANSQNSVRQSDLSANNRFHVELEKLSLRTYCPDGVGRWFYERATGSYNTLLTLEGTTPARLAHLKQKVIPPARKITKTDLAKYLNAWDQKPEIVSLGAQKNFSQFMDSICVVEKDDGRLRLRFLVPLPDTAVFKSMVAKAILFKKANSLIRPILPAFQGNVTIYVVALLANRLGDRFDFDVIWRRQELSPGLIQQIKTWAVEVSAVLHRTSNGRMISEWAKKSDCWEAVRSASYTKNVEGIAELR